jgi:Leucine-rich repeat (LRR) protein
VVGFAFDLECSEVEEENWDGQKDFACYVKTMNVTKKGESMNPSAIDDDIRVEKLEIRHQIVNYLPKFTVSLAQRLKYLSVASCHLKIVSKEDLEQFPDLTILSLSHNDLERLDGDLFDYNPRLYAVWFNDNKKLKFIGANLLDSLTELENADFTIAGCIDFDALKPATMSKLKEQLKTSCKDDSTEIKMVEDQNKTTTESTSSIRQKTLTLTATTLSTSILTATTLAPQSHVTSVKCSSDEQSESSSSRVAPLLSQVFVVLSFLKFFKL